MAIHPTAIIEAGAQLGVDVDLGAYSFVGREVVLGDRARLHHQRKFRTSFNGGLADNSFAHHQHFGLRLGKSLGQIFGSQLWFIHNFAT